MTEWKGANRRKDPRVKYPCLLVLQEKDLKDAAIMVETENISMGGIAITCKNNIKMLSMVNGEVDLGLEERICFEGKVIWTIQRKSDSLIKPLFYDIGISFEKIQKEDLNKIKSLVEKLKDKKGIEDFFIIQRGYQ